jgi:hypothetical protein
MATHEQFAEDLALYMLGELEPARAAEFKAHVESCPACQRELQQLRSDAAVFALSAAGPAPPARARERFVRAIAEESGFGRPEKKSGLSWFPAAVAVTCALIAGFLFMQNQMMKRTLNHYVRQNHDLESKLQWHEAQWAAVTSPDAVHMTLTTAHKPEPQGRVVYLPKQGTVMFFANYFSPLPEDKVYQLWLIPADTKKPMACGTFKPDATGMASFTMEYMQQNVPARSFAVTMEPEGGSQVPTPPVLMTAANRFPTE